MWVPDGWVPIMVGLHAVLIAVSPGLRYRQIKEEFGGLRIYATADGDPQVRDLSAAAEKDSLTVCESCGGPGTMHRNPDHWYRTLCRNCAAEHEQKYTPSSP